MVVMDDPRSRMAVIARRRRGLAAKVPILLAVIGVHGTFLFLMLSSAARVRTINPPSSPAISTWNILESNEAPPGRLAPIPQASLVQVSIEAPKIAIEEPAPIPAGLSAKMPFDPYAGASPVIFHARTLIASTVATGSPEPVAVTRSPPLEHRQAETVAISANAKNVAPKPVQCEVLAQPGGGFTSARIAQSSGDLAIDRRAVIAVMHHQELVAAGVVNQPQWLLLTDDELARVLSA